MSSDEVKVHRILHYYVALNNEGEPAEELTNKLAMHFKWQDYFKHIRRTVSASDAPRNYVFYSWLSSEDLFSCWADKEMHLRYASTTINGPRTYTKIIEKLAKATVRPNNAPVTSPPAYKTVADFGQFSTFLRFIPFKRLRTRMAKMFADQQAYVTSLYRDGHTYAAKWQVACTWILALCLIIKSLRSVFTNKKQGKSA